VKYWEIIADNLSKAGWSWDCVSVIDTNGTPSTARQWCHEKLTAFLELEAARRGFNLGLSGSKTRPDYSI
jgi:hypothetical protein